MELTTFRMNWPRLRLFLKIWIKSVSVLIGFVMKIVIPAINTDRIFQFQFDHDLV